MDDTKTDKQRIIRTMKQKDMSPYMNLFNAIKEQKFSSLGESFFIFRTDVCHLMKSLTDEEQLKLFWLIADYQLYGKEPEKNSSIDYIDILFFILKKKLSLDLDRAFRDFIAEAFTNAVAESAL